ncbi:hypothetical protein C8Q76DRAFT_698617 [Earliella scabrosa]|nr:hypothetical protein C8Q76DRAFT_698617 [Earliella scabrosa]
MSLHDKLLISLGNSNVTCHVYMVGGDDRKGEERDVFFLLAEYGKDIHVLFVCELLDGSVCAKPPVVLFRVMIPDDRVKIDMSHSQHAMQFSSEMYRFSLQFEEPADFWEAARIIAEAHAARELFKKLIEDLHADALSHVPTMHEWAKENGYRVLPPVGALHHIDEVQQAAVHAAVELTKQVRRPAHSSRKRCCVSHRWDIERTMTSDGNTEHKGHQNRIWAHDLDSLSSEFRSDP